LIPEALWNDALADTLPSKGESRLNHRVALAPPPGDGIDVLKGAAQPAARCDLPVGEVHDLHTQLTEAEFKLKKEVRCQ